jgi:hypothetical protein
MGSRIDVGLDGADHLVAHTVEKAVVGDVAGADDFDAALSRPGSRNMRTKIPPWRTARK